MDLLDSVEYMPSFRLLCRTGRIAATLAGWLASAVVGCERLATASMFAISVLYPAGVENLLGHCEVQCDM